MVSTSIGIARQTVSNEFPLFHGPDRAVMRLGASYLSIRVGKWQFGSPSVGRDGTIYCTPTEDIFGQALKAYASDGSELWQHVFDAYIHRPVISSEGTVYVATSQNHVQEPTLTLYAFTEAGDIRWNYSKPLRRSGSAPICDAHGNVYLIINEELHKINAAGDVMWTISVPGHEPFLLGIGSEQIFMLAGDGWEARLQAVSLEGKELWKLKAPLDVVASQKAVRQRLGERYGQERAGQAFVQIDYVPPKFENRAAITSLGNLIIVGMNDCFYSVSPGGYVNWQIDSKKAVIIGPSGKTAGAYVTWNEGLYAIAENGELLWKQRQRYITVPVVGRQGQIYVAGNDEASAFDAEGNLLWVKPIQGIPHIYPVLTQQDQFCVTTNQGYLYLFD